MEYVHGEDMRTLLKAASKAGQGVPLEHAINVILGVCGGLHHAHEKRGQDGKPLGIVHRDVSPSNVLVTYDGAVKLVDFGIAKATSHRAETRVGTLKGKIAYMSPEQCRGEPLDRGRTCSRSGYASTSSPQGTGCSRATTSSPS